MGDIHIKSIYASDVDWTKIKKESKTILSRNSEIILANFRLGIAMANLGQIEDAYQFFQKLSDKISTERFNQAINPYLEDLKKDPDNLLLLNYAAFSASINQQHQNTAEYFQEILKIEPKNIWIMNYLAATYIEMDQTAQAQQVLKETLNIKNNKYSHLLLGIIYYEEKDYIRALFEFGQSGNLVSKILLND